ncbi:uncharacterized protein PV07_08695 [Cladophialophora immunda]|uniref:Uncharacterized protein n=1 Tax=Cladophialophora immunda TaxID=569365 RepID=A0A0D2CPQ9_9EURO|nr:uncharacterized protein PV07_08695 [Cladophialophora immunda]KIW25529.1 hypothetical protein PV07_08695 [Cladophialophora immunda]
MVGSCSENQFESATHFDLRFLRQCCCETPVLIANGPAGAPRKVAVVYKQLVPHDWHRSKTFIDFINDLVRASKASPVFDMINLACFAVGLVPNPITMAVSITVQVAGGTDEEL